MRLQLLTVVSQPIEAGKTMGLFPYGKPNDKIPAIYGDVNGTSDWKTTNRDVISPNYPNGAFVNEGRFPFLRTDYELYEKAQNKQYDLTELDNRRDFAYAIQTQSQAMVLDLIRYAVKISGKKNVVLSGGYALNCVANRYAYDYFKNVWIMSCSW